MTCDEAKSLMCSYPGWHGLIDKLFAALPNGTEVLDMKEKFGGLRIELSAGEYEFAEWMDSAIEQESERTCFRCGQPAVQRIINGWWRSVCDLCYTKFSEAHRSGGSLPDMDSRSA